MPRHQLQTWCTTIWNGGDVVDVFQSESQTNGANGSTTGSVRATARVQLSVATLTATRNTTTGTRAGKTTAAAPDDGQLKLAGARLEHIG